MKELLIKASKDNLDNAIDFISEQLQNYDFTPKQIMQVSLVVEEIFVNVSSYAYNPITGDVKITVGSVDDGVSIEFSDNGKPYNPLLKADPDVTLSAEDRNVGGLGIYLTKKLMDDVEYRYEEGKNKLIVLKKK